MKNFTELVCKNFENDSLVKDRGEINKCYVCMETEANECKFCSFYFCSQHLWTDSCYKCLKNNFLLEFSKDSCNKSAVLIDQLQDLKEEKEVLISSIKKLESFSSSKHTLKLLSSKIEKEKKNFKALTITAENLKKALRDLKMAEGIINNTFLSDFDKIISEKNEILILKTDEFTLLNRLDKLNSIQRSSIQFRVLRNYICNSCISKIKKDFKPHFLSSLSSSDSLLKSIFEINKSTNSAPEPNSKYSCNCLIM